MDYLHMRYSRFSSSQPRRYCSIIVSFVRVFRRTISYRWPIELTKRANVLATLSWLPATASKAPKLELIQFFSAGTNHIAQHPIYTDSDIPLTTASGVHGPQIAEWVIMMDLVHSHNYIELYEQQKKKEWVQKTGMKVRDSVGRRVGVLGYGSIGRQGKFSPIARQQRIPCPRIIVTLQRAHTAWRW
jgi:phosphoglycerate dehydrogenase-like enzyme